MATNSKIYLADWTMVTSLGPDVRSTMEALEEYRSGIRDVSVPRLAQGRMMIGALPENLFGLRVSDVSLTENLMDVVGGRLVRNYAEAVLKSDNADAVGKFVDETVFVFATAKGNVSELEKYVAGGEKDTGITEYNALYNIACRVANGMLSVLGYEKCGKTEPEIYVVSNACISGVSALVVAKRLLRSGKYRNAVVVGADSQSGFITSGFASFKSLCSGVCRPYDASRDGLNLGEAAGGIFLTVDRELAAVLSESHEAGAAFAAGRHPGSLVMLAGGAVNSDANHISGPSRTGDGLAYAISGALKDAGVHGVGREDLSFMQMHGTATAYNDEMESKAAKLAGVEYLPCQSLKPYFGHTMGASGVVETIVCAEELLSDRFYGVPGYEECGTTVRLDVCKEHRDLEMKACVKTASGFGGSNAAVVLVKEDVADESHRSDCEHSLEKRISLVAEEVIEGKGDFAAYVRGAYKSLGVAYPKFYKMDDFCKLSYIASEKLFAKAMEQCPELGDAGPIDIACVTGGVFGSLDTDLRHQRIIAEGGDGAASPSVFVYTLPNVAAAEVGIKHGIKGESTWLALPEMMDNQQKMKYLREYAEMMMADTGTMFCLVGLSDFYCGDYFANFALLKTDK